MSSPSGSRLVDPRTLRKLKRSGMSAANAASSHATNNAHNNFDIHPRLLKEMVDAERGSREEDKSEGGSKGVDKRKEPSATATEIGETPSTKHKEIGLSPCKCCFNTNVKELNKLHGFVMEERLNPKTWESFQDIVPGYFSITDSNKNKDKIALAEVRKHSPFIYEVAKHFSFLTDTTKKILCNEDNDLMFRVAVAERLGSCIFFLKRLTTTINSNKKDNED